MIKAEYVKPSERRILLRGNSGDGIELNHLVLTLAEAAVLKESLSAALYDANLDRLKDENRRLVERKCRCA